MRRKFSCVIAMILLIALLVSAGGWQQIPQSSAAVLKTSAREQQIAQAAEALRPQLVSQRRDFHMHPELSNREERTSRIVAERLRALGL
ncbi:MAG: amidohydrolase, partial [Acidobacteria bacterium]|nr:amidohydrolase [Acidobacteriota bacterium]